MTEWEQMRSFLAECYRPDHVVGYKKYFEWQFRADTNINGGDAKLLCAWDSGRLAGTLGFLPLPVHWGRVGEVPKAVWISYWMVRKEAPRGLGRLLVKKIQEIYPFVLTVNASPIGGPLLKALGWSFFPRISRHICVLDRRQCVAMLLPGASENCLDSVTYISRGYRRGMSELSGVTPNKNNYDPDWRLYPGLLFGTVRSLEYLTWRYLDHPVFKYHIVIEGSPERPVVCVYRIERAFGYYEALVGRIVEFFYPNDQGGKTEGLNVMHAVLQHLKNASCAYADFICSNRSYGRAIVDLGGGEEPGDSQILPVRLTPIERSIRHQNFAYFTPQGYPSPALERMYVTKSDIDGDSPASIPANVNVAA